MTTRCKCGLESHCLSPYPAPGQLQCVRQTDADDGLCQNCRENIEQTGGYELHEDEKL